MWQPGSGGQGGRALEGLSRNFAQGSWCPAGPSLRQGAAVWGEAVDSVVCLVFQEHEFRGDAQGPAGGGLELSRKLENPQARGQGDGGS